MLIKHAVLGLLAGKPSHGYALRGALDARLGDLWEPNYGQVYQVLGDLERQGLITGQSERIGRRPPRKVYAITPAGRDVLRKWLMAPPSLPPAHDDLCLRLLFLDEIGREAFLAMLKQQTRRCVERLAELIDRREAARRLGAAGLASRLLTEISILHVEAEQRALQLCRAALVPESAGEGQHNGDGTVPLGRPATR